jgi:DegV family protein with EDD domain
MGVKVVTDSTSDLPPDLAKELDISVVPLMVRFGPETYRDGIDLSADEFYQKLVRGPALPTTAAPAPGLFAEVYERAREDGHDVLSVHISSKLSGTYDSALLGRRETKGAVEVIDSLAVSMGLGLLAVVAARAARDGANLADVTALVREKMKSLHLYGALDTLEYLHKGGRIGGAQAFLGSVLNFKPLITVRDGEVHPLERVRTRGRAIARLCELVEGFSRIEEMAVIHSTTPAEMEELAGRLADRVPGKHVFRARFGPVLGTYVGPGILAVAFLASK